MIHECEEGCRPRDSEIPAFRTALEEYRDTVPDAELVLLATGR